jgi:hypothetical protein
VAAIASSRHQSVASGAHRRGREPG